MSTQRNTPRVLGGTVSGLALRPLLGRADDTLLAAAIVRAAAENRIEVALQINGTAFRCPLIRAPRCSMRCASTRT